MKTLIDGPAMMRAIRLAIPATALLIATLGETPSAADAKDPPRGAAAPHALTGCEAFGSDFRKIEGTSTCIKMGGSVSVETRWSTGSGGGFFPFTPHR